MSCTFDGRPTHASSIRVTREGTNVYAEDQVLDVWVTPDHICHRKDEEELAAAVAQGLRSSDGWEDWRPDPGGTRPPLPQGVSWDFDLTPTHASQPSNVLKSR